MKKAFLTAGKIWWNYDHFVCALFINQIIFYTFAAFEDDSLLTLFKVSMIESHTWESQNYLLHLFLLWERKNTIFSIFDELLSEHSGAVSFH